MFVSLRTVAARVAVAVVTAATAVVTTPVAASAQSLGSLSWQLQPFCNRVTATVTFTGGVYTLDGYDDQCGAPQRAPLVGTAVLNPDGTAGLGFTVVTVPGGRSVHVDARVNPASGSGTWSDSEGNSGTFALGAATGGRERRFPTSAPAPGSYIDVPGTELSGPNGFGVLVTGTTPALGAAILAQWGEAPTVPFSESGALKGVSRDAVGIIGVSSTNLGVYGVSETRPGVGGLSVSGAGLAGASSTGPGVYAQSLASAGTALTLDNGGITVSGTARPAFQHVSTFANVSNNLTQIDHPLVNGRPTALLFITHVYGPGATNVYLNKPVGVYYAFGFWHIYTEDVSPMPVNARFNVLVVNQ